MLLLCLVFALRLRHCPLPPVIGVGSRTRSGSRVLSAFAGTGLLLGLAREFCTLPPPPPRFLSPDALGGGHLQRSLDSGWAPLPLSTLLESTPLPFREPRTHGKLPRRWLEQAGEGGNWRPEVQPGGPHLLPIPVPSIPVEQPRGQEPRKKRLSLIPTPGLT